MKVLSVLLLALIPFAIANPIAEAEAEAVAEPIPIAGEGPDPIPAGDAGSLMKRQSCTVTGRGGLNVGLTNACFALWVF
jgi:hypothetical protein